MLFFIPKGENTKTTTIIDFIKKKNLFILQLKTKINLFPHFFRRLNRIDKCTVHWWSKWFASWIEHGRALTFFMRRVVPRTKAVCQGVVVFTLFTLNPHRAQELRRRHHRPLNPPGSRGQNQLIKYRRVHRYSRTLHGQCWDETIQFIRQRRDLKLHQSHRQSLI